MDQRAARSSVAVIKWVDGFELRTDQGSLDQRRQAIVVDRTSLGSGYWDSSPPEAAVILLEHMIQEPLRVNEFVRRSVSEDVIRLVVTEYWHSARPE